MKKSILKLLLLTVTVSLLMGLVSCAAILDKLPFEIPGLTDKGNGDGDGGDEDLEGLVLIKNKVAQFQIVYTSEVGAATVKRIGEFVDQLRTLGVEIADPVTEGDKTKIAECEIIIGTGARNRGEDFNVLAKDLGKDGRVIKIVDKKILIAGGTAATTLQLFESYLTREMNITSKTASITSIAVNPEYSVNMVTDYRIDSIKVNGVEFKEYTIVYDIAGLGDFDTGALKDDFRDELYEISGCWFKEGSISKLDTYEHAFVIRYTEDAGEKGFRIYCDGKNIIAECSYANAFEPTFTAFMEEKIFSSKKTALSFASDFSYEKDVTVAYYKDFGAKGDGITCDFDAILATHLYANAGGQRVEGSANARYYISPDKFTQQIPVKTNVDLKGATVIIDDRGETAYANRGKSFFRFTSDNEVKTISVSNYKTEALEVDGVKVSVPAGTTKLDWITSYIEVTSMVRLRNKAHKDYIRYGSNQNEGQFRHEVIIVNPDGSIQDDTMVFFDYEKITDITIWRSDDKPITVENGLFYNVCCKAVESQGKVTKYHAYARNMGVGRANVTFKNLTHRMVDQPEVTSRSSDENGSYPYGGFLSINEAHNIKIQNCELAGHVTYYEKKAATESAGGVGGTPNYVAAGSYDFVLGDCTHIEFDTVTQKNMPYTMDDTTHAISKTKDADQLCNAANYWDIGNNYYWGIMCSNFVKNLKFSDCVISRIDAHEGFFNVEVTDTMIGHTFHAVGGGDLYVKDMTRLAGNSYIVTRGDYGGSFKGTMTIENGTLLGYDAYNSGAWNSNKEFKAAVNSSQGFVINTGYYSSMDEQYWTWDFGYDCYMPETVTMIGKFETGIENLYMFANDYDDYYEVFVPMQMTKDPNYHPYELTKYIVYQDWLGDLIPINRNAETNGTYDNPTSNANNGDYMASKIEVIINNTK